MAKVGAGGGVGLAMMVAWQKLFAKDERLEKVLDRLELMARELESVRTSLAVLVAASARRDDEVVELRAKVEAQALAEARHEAQCRACEARFHRIEHTMEQMREGGQ